MRVDEGTLRHFGIPEIFPFSNFYVIIASHNCETPISGVGSDFLCESLAIIVNHLSRPARTRLFLSRLLKTVSLRNIFQLCSP